MHLIYIKKCARLRKISMIDKSYFEEAGKIYNVSYKYEKKIVWAITYVDGVQIKAYGTDEETAYWAVQQKVYQQLNVRL